MSSSRRSPIALSPGFAPGDYNTNLVTAGLGMLEIGARHLNDWRSHELPDVLPFYQPGVPFNTPILLLAATSSIPTTWAVQVYVDDICSVRLTWDDFVRDLDCQLETPSHWLPMDSCKKKDKRAP